MVCYHQNIGLMAFRPTLLALENHISPYLGPIWLLYSLVQVNRLWKFDFWSNFRTKTRKS